jgi:hypothetical protein
MFYVFLSQKEAKILVIDIHTFCFALFFVKVDFYTTFIATGLFD